MECNAIKSKKMFLLLQELKLKFQNKLFYRRNYQTDWRGSEGANQVNEIKPELQEAFHCKEERNFDFF